MAKSQQQLLSNIRRNQDTLRIENNNLIAHREHVGDDSWPIIPGQHHGSDHNNYNFTPGGQVIDELAPTDLQIDKENLPGNLINPANYNAQGELISRMTDSQLRDASFKYLENWRKTNGTSEGAFPAKEETPLWMHKYIFPQAQNTRNSLRIA